MIHPNTAISIASACQMLHYVPVTRGVEEEKTARLILGVLRDCLDRVAKIKKLSEKERPKT